MIDVCAACGEPVQNIPTTRRREPINPEPDPRGSYRVVDSRAVPGEKFAEQLKGKRLLDARSAGLPLYRPHSETCRGR